MRNDKTKNIIIVGVGGQGTILAGKILSKVAEDAGYDVKVSEIHGMSQRGGSVVTQVRFGDKVASPIVIPGTVDMIVAFEKLEALRWSEWLSPQGIIIVNSQEVYPMPVISGVAEYPDDTIERIKERTAQTIIMDALKIAEAAANLKSVNMALLGRLSRYLDLKEEDWLKAIEDTVKPHTLKVNINAFKAGRTEN